jgi:hypothetical protein
MDKYYLSTKALYKLLKDKGVEYLYHSNTVLTSLTFINNRALLSRAFVENNNLTQTSQKSDNKDIEYNVWDDVFIDGIDLHETYKRPNHYGPILFVLKLEMLLSTSLQNVLITKNNPWYWKSNDNINDRYYSNIEDVKSDYLTGKGIDARIMFTFRSSGNSIRLNKYLHFICIDKPNIIVNFKSGEQKNIGDFAILKISEAMKKNGLGHISVFHRHLNGDEYPCWCNVKYNFLYNTDFNEFKNRFKAVE